MVWRDLARTERVEGGRGRKCYTATARGREELACAARLVAELYREVVAGESRDPGDGDGA